MIKYVFLNAFIASLFSLATAHAGQPYDCAADNDFTSVFHENLKTPDQETANLINQEQIHVEKDIPLKGISVKAMKPIIDKNCVHTYLRVTDLNGKNIELVVSYHNSKIQQDEMASYVDIGEWKIVNENSEIEIKKGSALVFSPPRSEQKRFVLQTLSQN